MSSHGQNPVVKWSTQNHAKNWEGGDPQLLMARGLSRNLHLPKSVLSKWLMSRFRRNADSHPIHRAPLPRATQGLGILRKIHQGGVAVQVEDPIHLHPRACEDPLKVGKTGKCPPRWKIHSTWVSNHFFFFRAAFREVSEWGKSGEQKRTADIPFWPEQREDRRFGEFLNLRHTQRSPLKRQPATKSSP